MFQTSCQALIGRLVTRLCRRVAVTRLWATRGGAGNTRQHHRVGSFLVMPMNERRWRRSSLRRFSGSTSRRRSLSGRKGSRSRKRTSFSAKDWALGRGKWRPDRVLNRRNRGQMKYFWKGAKYGGKLANIALMAGAKSFGGVAGSYAKRRLWRHLGWGWN